jgi:hypothetical protein
MAKNFVLARKSSHGVLKIPNLFLEIGNRRILVGLLLLACETGSLFLIALSEQACELQFSAVPLRNRVLISPRCRSAQAEQRKQSGAASKNPLRGVDHDNLVSENDFLLDTNT